jgi:hypothetical protein
MVGSIGDFFDIPILNNFKKELENMDFIKTSLYFNLYFFTIFFFFFFLFF